MLNRIGRPGEYDDEQAYAREEADALDNMDDLQRVEYLRAKGNAWERISIIIDVLKIVARSFHPGKSSRDPSNRHLVIAVPGNPREGSVRLGI